MEQQAVITGQLVQPILTTDFTNPSFDTTSSTWARDLVGGQTFPDYHWQWVPVLNTHNEFDEFVVGLSGTALLPDVSTDDVPFLHPFGQFDWEFFVAPDPEYVSLLAPTSDAAYSNATRVANEELQLGVPGVIGVETDQGLVPEEFRLQDRDRVCVFGRWIVDAGHEDFHSEIHPPLLLVSARGVPKAGDPDRPQAGPLDVTVSRVVSRPYLVSQEFGDGALKAHLLEEIGKVLNPVFPLSTRVEVHPRFLPKPFYGTQVISYTVRPPRPRLSPQDRLIATFHFTVRSGVTVQLINWRADEPDALRVLILMDDLHYTAPPLPQRSDLSITLDDLRRLDPTYAAYYEAAIFGGLLVSPAGSAILARGILTDQYDPPGATSVHDSEVTRIPVNDLRGNTPFSVDNSQPFPIYGFLSVEWERYQPPRPPDRPGTGL
jgi:hypothetical protein